jgi:energy-coupling factor transporter transmembrane protein EcfT
MLAADFGVGQVLWSLFWFFLFVLWIMLLLHVFGDIFRSKDLSGVAKVLWIVFVLVTPYLGVFVYLIARGDNMAANHMSSVAQQEAAMREYIQQTAGAAVSPAEELSRLADLKAQGVIDDAEFAALKAKLLA